MLAKILVVDSETTLIENFLNKTFRREIRQKEYEIFYATNLKEAWQKIQNHQIDLILLEITLKTENGFELLDEINEQQLDLKVIVISANDPLENCRKAFKKNAVDFLAKPLNPKEFSKIIKLNANSQALCHRNKNVSTNKDTDKTSRFRTITNLVDLLPPAKKQQLVTQLIERLGWLKSTKSDMTSLEERFRRDHEERVAQGKVSLLLLTKATIDVRHYTTAKNTKKIYYLLRWKDERNKLCSRSLTKEELDDPLVREIVEAKLGNPIELGF